MSRLALRGDPHAPRRNRCVTMIGAVAAVETIASNALMPRTPEYP
jgi:hypothetical protein